MSLWLLVLLMPALALVVFLLWYALGTLWEFWAAKRDREN